MYSDPTPTRIDYLKYDNMVKLNDLVERVRRFASKNPTSDFEDYIRQVVERIEDLFEGRVGPVQYVHIMRILRSLATFVRHHVSEMNDLEVISATDQIVKTVQGDNKMDKNTLISMTFRRVRDAINTTIEEDVTAQRIDTIAEEYASKIVYDVFGGKTPTETQTSEFVDKYYEMDPETEDLLDNGSLVVDGMKVLIESAHLREEITDDMTAGQLYEARRKNRWATVTNSRIQKVVGEEPRLSFIAVYDDGTKRKATHPVFLSWYVKKDTIPPVEPTDVVFGPQGNIVYQGTRKSVVRWLKNHSDESVAFYKVGTGDSKRTINARQFMEDQNTKYEVYDEEGAQAFAGNIDEVLKWAEDIREQTGYYAGFSVNRSGRYNTDWSLETFVQEYGG